MSSCLFVSSFQDLAFPYTFFLQLHLTNIRDTHCFRFLVCPQKVLGHLYIKEKRFNLKMKKIHVCEILKSVNLYQEKKYTEIESCSKVCFISSYRQNSCLNLLFW